MFIYIKQLIIIATLFSPAQLTIYKLCRADFNMGEIVFENDVQISNIGDKQYEITSSDGAKTFRSWDVISMIGPYVEFDTCDSSEQIRCSFDSVFTTQLFYSHMKPNIHSEIEFPLISTELVVDGPPERGTRVILRGKIAVELNNRFYIIARDYNTIDMIFSCTHFNVSSVLPRNGVLLVIQIFDIETDSIRMMRFILNFTDRTAARRFHNFVRKETSCTNNIIPVVIPGHIANIDE